MPQPLGTNATGAKLYARNLAKLLRIRFSGRLGLKGKGKSQSAAKKDMSCLVHDRADGRLCLKCDGTRAVPDFVFRRKVRVHLNQRGRQFSRLLAAELCASAVVMLDTPCSEVV